MSTISTSYYQRGIDVTDAASVEAELQSLLKTPIHSVGDLEQWLKAELDLGNRLGEVLMGHTIDFYRDTENEEKKATYLHDQSVIQPLLMKYQAEIDRKFCESPFMKELDDQKYGMMKKVRATSLALFRDENVPLQVREQELDTEYNAIMGGLLVDLDGERKPLPVVQALLDSPDRAVREKAWKGIAAAYASVKPECDRIMNELVRVRHQMAHNAGFENYRDYVFREKNREYTLDDCRRFHAAVEKYVVPVWDEVAEDLRKTLGVDVYRPWDQTSCTIPAAPFQEVDELMAGVETILRKTDEEFGDIFAQMRDNGLLDLEGRKGKAPGGFNASLMLSRTSFVFANFSPSYFAVIALIHEMGHAINACYQLRKEPQWFHHRSEIAELFSHSMELLCLDKLNEFYRDPQQYRAAVGERIRRSLNMLMGPLAGDLFQHWMYENPEHTAEERDAAYAAIMKRYSAHPTDWSGFEKNLGAQWVGSLHYFGYPFYNIEYSMAELGALQLLQQYQGDPAKAVANYKRGAAADYNQSIADVYAETGVKFDFSDEAIRNTAEFIRHFWTSLA
ncbi:M3 family oligoendopeptidase [Alicyclobacillus pomorum]|uniref:M3 family oligoendopeptidase n=1 Tax=Alicyclobacillus pomorum TaxID=204470 RepID=UPI0004047677|nr:M3 family oligoendopeptidase [Alicyclobacillus pomorum]